MIRFRYLLGVGLLSASFGLSACSDKCSRVDDCEADQVCYKGDCVSSQSESLACVTDEDCASPSGGQGLICVVGRCRIIGTTPTTPDAGEVDSGESDSGVEPADSGEAPADSGVEPTDSGETPADSGETPADSGETPADAGLPDTAALDADFLDSGLPDALSLLDASDLPDSGLLGLDVGLLDLDASALDATPPS